MSPDAYAEGGDAAGQYNCAQCFVEGKPKFQPSKSFDLCRLAVSIIIDTLWEEEPAPIEPRKILAREPGHNQPETVSPLWNLMWQWLTDKGGAQMCSVDPMARIAIRAVICIAPSPAMSKMRCPRSQLSLPLFDSAFRCRRADIPADATIWKLGSDR